MKSHDAPSRTLKILAEAEDEAQNFGLEASLA